MARNEEDREDLMAEATALAERVELTVPQESDFVTAGFRRTGHLSLYFGQDPAYHFDEEGRLRRAAVGRRRAADHQPPPAPTARECRR